MVLYFSGTGNSKLVAKIISSVTGDELVSINKHLKEGGACTFKSEKPYVFVAPTHGWRLPRIVASWIKNNSFEGCKHACFVLTCGDGSGKAWLYAKKMCKEKGFSFLGLASVKMPENYLAMFKTPSEKECNAIIEKAKPEIYDIAEKIKTNEKIGRQTKSLLGAFLSGPINFFYYPIFIHDKGFSSNKKCVSCGRCARVCPVNNIDIVEGKPIWKGRCVHCMACIAGCPTEAIEYKSKSKGQHRHYIMDKDI